MPWVVLLLLALLLIPMATHRICGKPRVKPESIGREPAPKLDLMPLLKKQARTPKSIVALR
jgi:hypothetical protein